MTSIKGFRRPSSCNPSYFRSRGKRILS
jgi:hypothetical protein